MASAGDLQCTLHLPPHCCVGEVTSNPSHTLPLANTHQENNAPKVGGPQKHVQVTWHLYQGIRNETGLSASPSWALLTQPQTSLVYLVADKRQLQGSRLEVALHGRVKEELREGHVHHPLLLLQLWLNCPVEEAPVPLSQGEECSLGLGGQGQVQGRLDLCQA